MTTGAFVGFAYAIALGALGGYWLSILRRLGRLDSNRWRSSRPAAGDTDNPS